ncbi:uncharacterized protein N7496_006351 [Penicillium cataractarum]|uniref:Uncharacterized protein n=1 Tax=Penicillium cataractarum TaxID=2100454 RepID=A0A9W9S3A4_9EURO|nr:uncharacterized protein N7496_006351 [Penicillium cataractarum]KAJ5370259.1 hypothetical protein N7496_006351 [Penicillium cataractarum]
MADKAHPEQTTQNTTSKYLTQDRLQEKLERLFPGQTEFNIRMREDQWTFTAPRIVSDVSIERSVIPSTIASLWLIDIRSKAEIE